MLCSPRLSRPEIYWFHVSGAAIVRSSNRKGIRSDISDGVVYDDFLTEFAAGPQYTSRYSKGGTAVAERANQTLTTIVCCLKLAGNFPDRAVSEFYDTAAHLHNRLPHGRTGNETTTPYELLHNKKTNLSYLRAIGCTAYVHQPGVIRPKKDSPRARKGTLIG
jgi:hypothetical protein